jgi:hypothetical protein
MIVLKLHDQWNYRCRQIVQESFGRSEKMMLKILQAGWSTRRPMNSYWEPDWHIPSNAIRAATILNVPALNQITNAIGAVTYIDDIRWTRNAIAHNIPVSFRKYRTMALSNYHFRDLMPYELPIQLNFSTGQSIYEDWCEQLYIALKNAL